MSRYSDSTGHRENELVDRAINTVVASYWSKDKAARRHGDRAVDYLSFDAPTGLVESEIEARLAASLTSAWGNGWLPREVIREVSRKGAALDATVIRAAVASHYRLTDPDHSSELWHDHVRALDLPDVRMAQWMTATRELQRCAWCDVVQAGTKAIAIMAGLGVLEPLLEPPGAEAGASAGAGRAQRLAGRKPSTDPMLEKIRSLLALAESTGFEAEAEAFTAKAQTLMTQHSLDEATVWGASANRAEPSSIRIPVDDPYSNAKGYLLQVVADACNCQAVYHPAYAMSSVVGFDSDLAATEVLFTSLLVQVQTALQRYANAAPAGTKSRSRSFRSSFLRAYGNRVGLRLQEISDHERTQRVSESGGSLLPVFVERDEAVAARVDELFTIDRSRRRRSFDQAGWVAGDHAAESAELGSAVGHGG